MSAEEHLLEYHWTIIPLALHKREDDTRVWWKEQPSLPSQQGHCLWNILVAALLLNRDLASEDNRSQTCLIKG